MKIAAYVRQTPGRTDPDTAFAQGERIRRWARDTANELVITCQDDHTATDPADRPGFKALLDVVRAGNVDAVLIGSLSALSPDKVMQEIMLTDLRAAGVTVIATDEDDLEALRDGGDDHTRMVVRDIVAKLDSYRDAFGLSGDQEPSVDGADAPKAAGTTETTDVVVELIAPTG